MDVHQPRASSGSATLDVRLADIRPIARDTNLYEFRALDGSPLPPAEAGAHIDLYLPNGMVRQYSLVAAGDEPDCYQLGIKLDPNTRGGSHWIFNELHKGHVVTISRPRNHFPLAQARYSILIAGGIGITPIRAMLWQLHAVRSACELHYACRSRGDMAFLNELESLSHVHLHCDDENGSEVIDISSIVANAPRDAHLYCCGPSSMLQIFQTATAGFPSQQIHFEYFSAKDERSIEGGFTVELARTGGEFYVQSGQSILETLREAGIDVDSSCQEGICGVCETRVISGEPDHRDSILSEEEHQSNRSMMICCSGSKSTRLVLDL